MDPSGIIVNAVIVRGKNECPSLKVAQLHGKELVREGQKWSIEAGGPLK